MGVARVERLRSVRARLSSESVSIFRSAKSGSRINAFRS
jgi:hypothetical protein